ncbi:hypothetical protein TspCOW1_20840 [Thiohalobacter sp. COW1]|uniref:hypothetical protein n=1 Tax=Thiohalobacter sp. COW1 TaxID=2795687 RepID=UPI001915A996|nr:hypothetical protein [Thiohalobacter sp. COW1]BCO31981.1 hypothetical protein TspCOW1_20840 [Thiohalobacter sp. COW1]
MPLRLLDPGLRRDDELNPQLEVLYCVGPPAWGLRRRRQPRTGRHCEARSAVAISNRLILRDEIAALRSQ